MKQVTDEILFIEGRDDFIPDAHVYVLGARDSGDFSLVDAGLMGKGAYKIQSIESAGIALSDIRRIIMTHTHLDHIGCLPELLEKMPRAELWVHAAEGVPLETGDDRVVYGMDMFKQMCQAQYSLAADAFHLQVHRKLEDGETLSIGGMSWEVLHIPGHSPGGIALYSPSLKVLIPGDVVYADYAIGRFDLHGASGAQLKASLERLGELDVEVLLPGHNEIDERVPAGYIRETARQWAPYLT